MYGLLMMSQSSVIRHPKPLWDFQAGKSLAYTMRILGIMGRVCFTSGMMLSLSTPSDTILLVVAYISY